MNTAIARPAPNFDTHFRFAVEGMSCASCVNRIEKAVSKLPGVTSAAVNLATESAELATDGTVSPEALVTAIEGAGYQVRSDDPQAPDSATRVEEKHPGRRRVFSMMTTDVGATTGSPSEWSATIDRLAFGAPDIADEGAEIAQASPRLFVLSAGSGRESITPEALGGGGERRLLLPIMGRSRIKIRLDLPRWEGSRWPSAAPDIQEDRDGNHQLGRFHQGRATGRSGARRRAVRQGAQAGLCAANRFRR